VVRAGAILLAVSVLGLGVLAPNPAAAADTYTVTFDVGDADYQVTVCLKSTTTWEKFGAGEGGRICKSPGYLPADDIPGAHNYRPRKVKSVDLTVDYNEGDTLWADVAMQTGWADATRDVIDQVVTGAHTCRIWGKVLDGRLQCDTPTKAPAYSPSPIAAYPVDYSSDGQIIKVLNLMAWYVSAAAMIGLILTGAALSLQLRRGVTGEGGEYGRQLFIVAGACLLAASAGPIIEFFGFG
jgi:hypothetical protein